MSVVFNDDGIQHLRWSILWKNLYKCSAFLHLLGHSLKFSLSSYNHKLPQLEYLDISGNPVRDLSFLVALPALRTLKLMDIGGADVAPLKDLPALKTVYVRYDDAAAVLAVLGDRAVDVIVRP